MVFVPRGMVAIRGGGPRDGAALVRRSATPGPRPEGLGATALTRQEAARCHARGVERAVGSRLHLMAIWRALRRLKITFKKKDLHASERDSPRVRRMRRAFREQVAAV